MTDIAMAGRCRAVGLDVARYDRAADADDRNIVRLCLPDHAVERIGIGRVQQDRFHLLHEQIGQLADLLVDVAVSAGVLDVDVVVELLGFVGDPYSTGVNHGPLMLGMVTPILSAA